MRSSRPAPSFRLLSLASLASLAALSAVALASVVVACSSSGGSTSGDGRTGNETPDAAPDAAPEAAADSGGAKALGDTCTVDGDCASGHCLTQGTGMDGGAGEGGGGSDGGGGGRKGSFCSVPCATANQSPAPECSAPVFTGKCGGRLFCQIK